MGFSRGGQKIVSGANAAQKPAFKADRGRHFAFPGGGGLGLVGVEQK